MVKSDDMAISFGDMTNAKSTFGSVFVPCVWMMNHIYVVVFVFTQFSYSDYIMLIILHIVRPKQYNDKQSWYCV